MSPRKEPVITETELWAEIDRVVSEVGLEAPVGKPGPEWFTALEFAAKRSLSESTARDHINVYIKRGLIKYMVVTLPNTSGSMVRTKVFCLAK